jgi:hypothetical protein|tara:strand:- start:7794 stop:8201 length:408 start_codon:yes stop_codon:yes gene_type:complete
MAFVEVAGLGDDYEDQPVAEGNYNLRIQDARDGRNKANTCDQIVVIIHIDSEEGGAPTEGAGSIFHYLTFPADVDEDSVKRFKMRDISRFLHLFNVQFEKKGLNSEDMIGQTATCLVVQDEYEGKVSNKLKLPRA